MARPGVKAPEWDTRYAVDESGCWIWNGALDRNGYGVLTVDGRFWRAHRYALQRVLDRPLATGEMALHSCDVPACVNPDHLRPGTAADNSRDMRERGRSKACGTRGPGHYRTKLSEEDVREMRRLRSNGAILDSLASRFCVSIATVSRICNRKSWHHLS